MSFSSIIKQARQNKGLLLRQVASLMDIDQATISKFEKGERKPTREQVILFSQYYNIDRQKLLIAWLSDKVLREVGDEDFAEEALIDAVERLKFQPQIRRK